MNEMLLKINIKKQKKQKQKANKWFNKKIKEI